MSRLWNQTKRLLLRFRFPISLPEEVAEALGIYLPSSVNSQDLIARLTNKGCQPTRLIRFMPRYKAEEAFHRAWRCDRFSHITLFTYYFLEGLVEFCLHFDAEGRLRRLYVQHRSLKEELGIEIPLGVSSRAFM